MNAITQAVSLLGALLVLIAYIAHQARKMDGGGVAYNVLNTVGAGILAYMALRPFQAGFLLLEGTWTLVSLAGLYRALTQERS